MRSKTRTCWYVLSAILTVVAVCGIVTVCFAAEQTKERSATDTASGNSKCYVCHPGLKTEQITTNHLSMGITCDQCHGPSIEHMHDEMLMTEPDLLFGRAEVQKMCSNPSCHPPGGDRVVYGRQDHKNTKAVEDFFKKWRGRTRANGRAVSADSVCTDCHGTHNVDKPIQTQSDQEQPADWIPLFNGNDLDGWRHAGGASWTVERGRLIAAPPPAGGADLFTGAEYNDYQLAVTFRATWPVQAGIWLRHTKARPGPRIEICERKEPAAFTGTISVPGKGLALVNLRSGLVDRESWNTIAAKVEGRRAQVWLNGEEIGAVRIDGPAKGNIGLHIEKHPASKTTQLEVRELLVQPLKQAEQSAESSAGSE
ncbi:MAG: DUF1080 domain-containing protein [Phycisphaerales bacterium]|nr:MAG: DUF1080 domain-containing protein [Phycisphaerales bacterium]